MNRTTELTVTAVALTAAAVGAFASGGDVLYSNDFESEPASKGFTVEQGLGRNGSAALVATIPKTNTEFWVQKRWPLKQAKPGMTFSAEVWFLPETNGPTIKSKPAPALAFHWTGPGYEQTIGEKRRWVFEELSERKKGKPPVMLPAADGWYRLETVLTVPLEGDANVPELCLTARWFTECVGGTLRFDDLSVRETGRVYTGAIGSDAYRGEASSGGIRFAVAHFLDRPAIASGGYEAAFLWSDARGAAREQVVSDLHLDSAAVDLRVEDFPPGTNEVAFVIRESATKRELGRSTTSFVRTPAPRRRRVALDRHGRTWVDGKLFFPIGMYTWPTAFKGDSFERYAKAGVFNCINDNSRYMTRELLDKYWRAGLMTIASLSCHYSSSIGCSPAAGVVTDEDGQRASRKVIEECRDHPGLLAWYTCDEQPAWRAPLLEAKYRLVRELDPDHPVVICVYDCNSLRAFMNACDAFGTDKYPRFDQPRDTGVVHETGEWLAAGKKASLGLRAMWQVPPIYNYRWDAPPSTWKTTNAKKRSPTFREFRSMVWQQIAVGANGIDAYTIGQMVYREYGTIDFEENFNTVVGVLGEVKRLQDVLLREPGPELAVVRPEKLRVRTWAGEDDSSLYVLAANPHVCGFTGDVALPAGDWKVAKAVVPAAGAKVDGAVLSLALEPYEHVLLRLVRTADGKQKEQKGL